MKIQVSKVGGYNSSHQNVLKLATWLQKCAELATGVLQQQKIKERKLVTLLSINLFNTLIK